MKIGDERGKLQVCNVHLANFHLCVVGGLVAPRVAPLLRLCCGSDLNFVSYLPICCGCCGGEEGVKAPSSLIRPVIGRACPKGLKEAILSPHQEIVHEWTF